MHLAPSSLGAAVENSARSREREKTDAINAAQTEYAKLEARLRKALIDVETRERKLKSDEAQRAAEHAQKIQDVQMLSRRGREEVSERALITTRIRATTKLTLFHSFLWLARLPPFFIKKCAQSRFARRRPSSTPRLRSKKQLLPWRGPTWPTRRGALPRRGAPRPRTSSHT